MWEDQDSIRRLYLADLPLLHTWDSGATWNTGGFDPEELGAMIALVRSSFTAPRVVETGAGNSTSAFLLKGAAEVLSICPELDLFQRIREYCDRVRIDTSPLRTICDLSEWALPRLARDTVDSETSYDFALIDGARGWPNVMVDFCYLNSMLRRGGLLMLDDLQLHSVRELQQLLNEQPGFEEILRLRKSVVFRKESDERMLPDWGGQPYIVRNSGA